MSFTYAQLKTAIQDYTENDETTFVNNIDNFIKSAEERILKAVQLSIFRKNATGTTTASNKYLAVPSDFLAPFSLSVTSSSEHVFLLYKDVNFVQTYSPNPATTGTPKYYGLFDNDNFILGPTPDAAYNIELHYWYRPTSLTAGADSGTTWLSENAPQALLFGALSEANMFMKGEADLAQSYNARFTEAMQLLKLQGEAKENSDEYRVGQIMRGKS
jgi:hypothetical protein